MNWSFMNDDAGLAGETCENWLITADESDNAEIVAVVPKTGDEDYDNAVTFNRVRLISAAPELLDLLARALPFIEDAESDPAYKAGFVRKLTREIREAIERL